MQPVVWINAEKINLEPGLRALMEADGDLFPLYAVHRDVDGLFIVRGYKADLGIEWDEHPVIQEFMDEEHKILFENSIIESLKESRKDEILDYWNLCGSESLYALNFYILLAKQKMLPPIPTWIRNLKGETRSLFFHLHSCSYFVESKFFGKEIKIKGEEPSLLGKEWILLIQKYHSEILDEVLDLYHSERAWFVKTAQKMSSAGLGSWDDLISLLMIAGKIGMIASYSDESHLAQVETGQYRMGRVMDLFYGCELKDHDAYAFWKVFGCKLKEGKSIKAKEIHTLLKELEKVVVIMPQEQYQQRYDLYCRDWKWSVEPLDTIEKIRDEGSFQDNCLQSPELSFGYQIAGYSSLFSLRNENKRITIEVDEKGCLVQARGFKNSKSKISVRDLDVVERKEFQPSGHVFITDKLKVIVEKMAVKMKDRNAFLNRISEMTNKGVGEIMKTVREYELWYLACRANKLSIYSRFRPDKLVFGVTKLYVARFTR